MSAHCPGGAGHGRCLCTTVTWPNSCFAPQITGNEKPPAERLIPSDPRVSRHRLAEQCSIAKGQLEKSGLLWLLESSGQLEMTGPDLDCKRSHLHSSSPKLWHELF